MSAATAGEIGAAEDDLVSVRTERGAITLPLVITDMPDATVWLPLNSPGSAVHQQLGVTTGAVVSIGRASQ
jgi:NADH-quinone oxidoreductase subunit G